MRPVLPLALLLLAAPMSAPALADEPAVEMTCYDVAALGSLRYTDEGYRVSVSKTYVGGRTPNSIEVFMDHDSAYPSLSYHRNAVFYLKRLKDGYFGVLSTAGREPLDGRGLLTRARVHELARDRKLSRCAAES